LKLFHTELDALSVLLGPESVPRNDALRLLCRVMVRQQRVLHILETRGEKFEIEHREILTKLRTGNFAKTEVRPENDIVAL
jgi:hypothetical protein